MQEELPAPVSERTPMPETNQQRCRGVFQQRQENAREDCEDCEIEVFPPDLNGCFSNEGFDAEHFEDFARDCLSQECETTQEYQNQRKEKANIVSVLARTSTSCAR